VSASRAGLDLFLGLACCAAAATVLLWPSPAHGERNREAILSAKALGAEAEEPVTLEERLVAAEASLVASHPPGGLTIVNVFRSSDRRSSSPAVGNFPELFPPQQLEANAQEGGVRLTWSPHPSNPINGLRYRIERWSPSGELQAHWVVDGLEQFDRLDCEGVSYVYRASSQLERQLLADQAPLVRHSPPARAPLRLERLSKWEVQELHAERLILRLNRPQASAIEGLSAEAGEPLGSTGWIMESWTKGETEVDVVANVPRFDEWGRRVVIDGQPASRSTVEGRTRRFVTLYLVDPCGVRLRENLFLPD